MKANQIVLDKQTALRELYHGFVELILEFQETMAFGEEYYDEDLEYEYNFRIRRLNASLQKARIDLKRIIFNNLNELLDQIVSTTLEDLLEDGNEDEEEVVELKSKEFYEKLASIMAYYINQN